VAISFDPRSPGAQRLARDWLPELERWALRVPDGHMHFEEDGTMTSPGAVIDVSGPRGRELAARGYEVLSVKRISAHH
jgi:hypothetical protein